MFKPLPGCLGLLVSFGLLGDACGPAPLRPSVLGQPFGLLVVSVLSVSRFSLTMARRNVFYWSSTPVLSSRVTSLVDDRGHIPRIPACGEGGGGGGGSTWLALPPTRGSSLAPSSIIL
jgi:hypothetical protein